MQEFPLECLSAKFDCNLISTVWLNLAFMHILPNIFWLLIECLAHPSTGQKEPFKLQTGLKDLSRLHEICLSMQ